MTASTRTNGDSSLAYSMLAFALLLVSGTIIRLNSFFGDIPQSDAFFQALLGLLAVIYATGMVIFVKAYRANQ